MKNKINKKIEKINKLTNNQVNQKRVKKRIKIEHRNWQLMS